MLAELLPKDAVVTIPSVTAVDVESLSILRPLLRRRSEAADLHVVVGHLSDDRPAKPLASVSVQLKERELRALSALPGSSREELTAACAPVSATDGVTPEWVADPLDYDLERQAYQALRKAVGVPDSAVCARGRAAVEAAFAAHGHTTAMTLAQELLNRHPGPPAEGMLHTVLALASYGRNPHPFLVAEPSEPVEEAREHLERAIELVEEPDDRCPLLYRRAMFAARNEGDMQAALRWSDLAVGEARGASTPGRAAFLEARARAGRALARFRLGHLEAARSDCEAALDVLRGARDAPGISSVEVRVAEQVLVDNYARVCLVEGRADAVQAFQERCLALDRQIPQWRQAPFLDCLLDGANIDLERAVNHFTERLDRARREWDPVSESFLAFHLGALHYRRGDAAAAEDCYRATGTLWRSLDQDPTLVLSAVQNQAIAALRAGRLDAAETAFQGLLDHPLCGDHAPQAEILGALGLVAARRGAADLAQDRAERAVQEARLCDAEDVVVRVLRTAADIALALGLARPARERLDEAAGRARASHDPERDPSIPPEDRLGVLVSLHTAGDPDPGLVREAVLLAPMALRDPTAWWELPHLIPAATAWLRSRRRAGDPVEPATWDALDRLCGATSQRLDCRRSAADLEREIAEATRS